MINYVTHIQQFDEKGEKSGWSYIEIPAAIALQLYPGNKKSFRVKGTLDNLPIHQVSMLPMGEGDFIIPLNAGIRKSIRKEKGAEVVVELERDHSPVEIIPELLECLQDEPEAMATFEKIPKSHQNYYSNWIKAARTDATRTKRIAMTVNAMLRKMDFGQMLRAERGNR